MPALKSSSLRSAFRSLASSTAKRLRFLTRQETVTADPARRRLMAGTFAAAAVAPLPVFGGSGSIGPENQELIAAGEAFDRADTALVELDARIRECRAVFDRLSPPVPDGLAEFSERHLPSPDNSRPMLDVEGRQIYEVPDNYERCLFNAHAPYLRIETEDYGPRTKRGKAARAKLKLLETYQAAYDAAKDQSGIGPLVEARPAALEDLKQAGERVATADAFTMQGLTIKARVYTAYARSDNGLGRYWALLWGPHLAANILRVTGPA